MQTRSWVLFLIVCISTADPPLHHHGDVVAGVDDGVLAVLVPHLDGALAADADNSVPGAEASLLSRASGVHLKQKLPRSVIDGSTHTDLLTRD